MQDIVVENGHYTLVELRECSRLQESFIIACVEHGVIEVSGAAPPQWRFGNRERQQLQKAWRLHQDLELQISALPLVLELLDEIDALRSEAQLLRQRLGHWEG
jgi:chaperone modulatory protein CbpM